MYLEEAKNAAVLCGITERHGYETDEFGREISWVILSKGKQLMTSMKVSLFEERSLKLNFKGSRKSYRGSISWFPRKCKKELC